MDGTINIVLIRLYWAMVQFQIKRKNQEKENKVPLSKLRIYDILKVVILYSFRKGKTILEKKEKEISQHEDVAEKVAWQFFKDEVHRRNQYVSSSADYYAGPECR